MRKVLIACLAVLLSACGDDLRPSNIDQPDAEVVIPPDAEIIPPDAMICPARDFGEIGGPCDSDDDCGARPDSRCYFGSLGNVLFAPEGYCMDDNFTLALGTCATDGDCATGTVCTEWLDFAGYKSCMPSCSCEDNTCPENQACLDSWTADNSRLDRAVCVPGNSSSVDGAACVGFYACNEASSCFNDIEFPGGECEQYGCTVGTDSTCNGGHCIVDPDPPVTATTTCVDTCSGNGDCRTAEGYVCFDPDGAGTAPNYCRHPHVGDACATAAGCGGGLWECKTGAFTGGYCTMTGCPTPGSSEGCTDGSICYDDPIDATNYCVDRCTGAAQGTCRTGYLCSDTDPSGTTALGCVTP